MDPDRRTAVIRGVLAVLAVLVLYAAWSIARLLIYLEYSTPEQLNSPWGGPALWIALPQLLSSFLMVVIGAWIYGRDRLRSLSGALVVLTLPVLVFLLDVVSGLLGDAPGNVLFMRVVAASVGIGGALWLVFPRKRAAVSSQSTIW